MTDEPVQRSTAAELAAMHLPGLPHTERGIQQRAGRENWERHPHSGRGGGWEYPSWVLPPAAREALARRIAGPRRPPERVVSTQSPLPPGRNLAALPKPAQLRADARIHVLDAFARYRRASGLKTKAARESFARAWNQGAIDAPDWVRNAVPTLAASTLARWRRAMNRDGLAVLAGGYGNRKGQGAIDRDAEVRDLVVGMMVDHPHCSAKHVMRALRARFERGRYPSYRAVQRWMAAWKTANAAAFATVVNPDEARSKYRVSFGSASEKVTALNARWEWDSTPADVMLTDGRHSVLGVIDVYSRRAKLLVSKTSKASAVAALMRRALLDWGVPKECVTDNGQEYISHRVKRILDDLDIVHTINPPFTPEKKPFIERLFGTFSHDLVELLSGYVGHSVADRKDIEARRSFAQRLGHAGEVVDIAMTGAEFQVFCDRWTDQVYAHDPHKGLGGKSPFEVAAAWRGILSRIENERALDILLADAPGDGFRVVGKKGVAVDGATYIHEELAEWVGRKIRVLYDEHDMGRIYCFSPDTSAFVCAASCSAWSGIDRADVAARAGARRKAHLKADRRALRSTAKTARTADIVDEILGERERANTTLIPFPAAEAPLETPATDAAAEAREAGSAIVHDLSAERDAEAARLWDDIERAPGDGPAANRDAGASPSPADGRPAFDDDLGWWFWCAEHPDETSEDQRAYLDALHARNSDFRLRVELEEEDRAKKKAAGDADG